MKPFYYVTLTDNIREKFSKTNFLSFDLPAKREKHIPFLLFAIDYFPILDILNEEYVGPAKALMPTMLVQEHKDKTITHTVHEVLAWFGQPCLRPGMRENDSTIQ